MTTYFISGHRDITNKEFQQHYAKPIMNAILKEPDAAFVVGDYYGVDEMAQKYLSELKKKYTEIDVMVYHMHERPRKYVDGFTTVSGYTDDHHRDSAMTSNSDEDIAWVRAGKANSGTAQNILRRNVKNLVHSMDVNDAIQFLQGLLNVSENHPDDLDNVFNEAPLVYWP